MPHSEGGCCAWYNGSKLSNPGALHLRRLPHTSYRARCGQLTVGPGGQKKNGVPGQTRQHAGHVEVVDAASASHPPMHPSRNVLGRVPSLRMAKQLECPRHRQQKRGHVENRPRPLTTTSRRDLRTVRRIHTSNYSHVQKRNSVPMHSQLEGIGEEVRRIRHIFYWYLQMSKTPGNFKRPVIEIFRHQRHRVLFSYGHRRLQ